MKRLARFSVLAVLLAVSQAAAQNNGNNNGNNGNSGNGNSGTDGLSDRELFDRASTKGIGKCYLSDARQCKTCFADYYVKSSLVSWGGKGWPVNPASKDSTGAVVPAKRKNYNCWGGYRPNMCHNSHRPAEDVVKNAAAQLRDAINNKSNPCGIVKGKG